MHRNRFLEKKLRGKEVILNALHISFEKTSPLPWFLSLQTLLKKKMTDTNKKFAERVAQFERKRLEIEEREKTLTTEERDTKLREENLSLRAKNLVLRERELDARLDGCEQTLTVLEDRCNQRKADLEKRNISCNRRETKLLILEQELQSKEEVVAALKKRFVRIPDTEAPSPRQLMLEMREAEVNEAEARVGQLEKSIPAERKVISEVPRVEIEIASPLPEQELQGPDSVSDDNPWNAPAPAPQAEAKAPDVAEVAQASPEAQPNAISPSEEVEAPEVEGAEQAPPETAEEAERAERARERAKKILGIPTWLWTTAGFAAILSYIVVLGLAFAPAPYTPSWGPAVRYFFEGDRQKELERIQKRNAELEKLKEEKERQEDPTR